MKSLGILVGFILLSITACNEDENNQSFDQLTEAEKQGLIFTRQEEILAYDVYRYAFNKYGSSIFNNISNSELTHQSAVESLLDKYGIENPVKNMGPGLFENAELQTLYLQLTQKVDLSLADALEAGATIEDLDIDDLMKLLAETQKSDLISTYEMLTCGSRNHLRGFTSQLANLGKSYAPQFLDQTTYTSILRGNHENCGR